MDRGTIHNHTFRVGLVTILLICLVGIGVSSAAAAGTTDVEVTPATQTIDAGTTTTANVTVSNASGGVGAYNFSLSTDNAGTVSITNVQAVGQASTSISNDGSVLTADAFGADTADTGSVTIATITILGTGVGQSSLSLSVNSLGDESGTNYAIESATDANISVRESTVIQDEIILPATVDENQTVSTSIDFDVANVSSDGNTDDIAITGESDLEFASPTVTITDGDSSTIQLDSGPSLNDANGGTNNQISFAISPDNSFNTSLITVSAKADITYPQTNSNQSRDIDIDVTDSSGDTATATTSVTVNNTDTGGGSQTQTVELSPAKQNVTQGGTVTYDLVVTGVNNGVGAYNMSIETNNSNTATITNATIPSDIRQATSSTQTSISSSNDKVTLGPNFGLDTADSGSVTIGTVEIEGQNPGSRADIEITDIVTLGDEAGTAYNVSSVTNSSVQVTAGPGDVTGNGNAAQDLDSDGAYEDINGNGQVDLLDVQVLFANLNQFSSNQAFDINGDNQVNLLDVQTLFSQT